MQRKLHLLESYQVTGSDGKNYKVCGYEHLTRDESLADGVEHWEPTGVLEFRLADGAELEPHQDGTMTIPETGVVLPAREKRQPSPKAA